MILNWFCVLCENIILFCEKAGRIINSLCRMIYFCRSIVTTHHDHRIAMAFTIAGLRAGASLKILDCAHVATSFPNFVELARTVGITLDEEFES